MSNTSGEKGYRFLPYLEVTFKPSTALKKFVKENHSEMWKRSFITPIICEIPEYIASMNKCIDPVKKRAIEVKLMEEICKKSNYKPIHPQFPMKSATSSKSIEKVATPNPSIKHKTPICVKKNVFDFIESPLKEGPKDNANKRVDGGDYQKMIELKEEESAANFYIQRRINMSEEEEALEEEKKTELKTRNRRLQEQRQLSMSMPNLFVNQDDEEKYRKLMNTVSEYIPIVQQFGY